MIALLKYGSGMPFNRAERLQASLGIPLPASTQWDIVRDQAERAEPAFEELIARRPRATWCINDDTTVKILEVMGERRQAAMAEEMAAVEADPHAGDRCCRALYQAGQAGANGHVHLGHRVDARTAGGSRCSSAGASTPART